MINNSKNTNKAVLLSIGVKDKDLIERVSDLGHNFLNAFVEAKEMNIPEIYINKSIEMCNFRALETFIDAFKINSNEDQLENIQKLVDEGEYFQQILYLELIKGLKTYKSKEYTNKEIEDMFFDEEYFDIDREALVTFINKNFSIETFIEFTKIHSTSLKEAILEKGSILDVVPNISENILRGLFTFTEDKGVMKFTRDCEFVQRYTNLSDDLKDKLFSNIFQWRKCSLEKHLLPLTLKTFFEFFETITPAKLLSTEYKDDLLKRLFIDHKFNDMALSDFMEILHYDIKVELTESIIKLMEDVFEFNYNNKMCICQAINHGIMDMDVINFISGLGDDAELCEYLITDYNIKDKENLELMLDVFKLEEVNPFIVSEMIKENRDRKEIEKYIEVRKLSTKEECINYFKNEYDEEFLNSIFE